MRWSSIAAVVLVACSGEGGDDAGQGTSSASTASVTGSSSASTTTATTTPADDTGSSTDSSTTDATEMTATTGITDFRPCDDQLWAWAWGGEDGAFVELEGDPPEQWIRRMVDQSGNGRDYVNEGPEMPAYQLGYSWDDGDYSTELPIVAVNTRDTGMLVYEQYMFQDESLDAAGGFYLAFAGMNTRDGGQRELWGTTEQDTVRLDQERDRVNIVIAGQNQSLTAEDAMDKGPLLLEVWREDDGSLHAFINGADASEPGAMSGATFALSGIGSDQTGSSGWDDYAFEYIVCAGVPTGMQRDAVREYLRDKWGLY